MLRAFVSDQPLIRFAGNDRLAETRFEDYAFVAQAFRLYAILTRDKAAQRLAVRLVDEAYRFFFVDERWMSNRNTLMPAGSGQWVIQDAVIASALTQWLLAALNLSDTDSDMGRQARNTLQRETRNMIDIPYYYGSLIALRHSLINNL